MLGRLLGAVRLGKRTPCETRPGLDDHTLSVVHFGAGDGDTEWKDEAGPFFSVDGAVRWAKARGADWLRVDDLKGRMLAIF